MLLHHDWPLDCRCQVVGGSLHQERDASYLKIRYLAISRFANVITNFKYNFCVALAPSTPTLDPDLIIRSKIPNFKMIIIKN